MPHTKKVLPTEKTILHPRNKHRERYNFKELTSTCPELKPFVILNKYNDESIDFSNAEAVLMLNKALLKHFYSVDYWSIPKGYLCPPIPGRADYIHYIADLLATKNQGKIPTGNAIQCLDIGVGANCIYPIIGNKEYGWSFVGTDIETTTIQSATKIIEENAFLKNSVELRLQKNPNNILRGIIKNDEYFDLTICNPPFHASFEETQSENLRKLRNLKHTRNIKPTLNFGGKNMELWCEGGEKTFVVNMITQSKELSTSCLWFSTLISNESHLKKIYKVLKELKAFEFKTITMTQGNKTSRIVAWTFFNEEQQKNWMNARWNK